MVWYGRYGMVYTVALTAAHTKVGTEQIESTHRCCSVESFILQVLCDQPNLLHCGRATATTTPTHNTPTHKSTKALTHEGIGNTPARDHAQARTYEHIST